MWQPGGPHLMTWLANACHEWKMAHSWSLHSPFTAKLSRKVPMQTVHFTFKTVSFRVYTRTHKQANKAWMGCTSELREDPNDPTGKMIEKGVRFTYSSRLCTWPQCPLMRRLIVPNLCSHLCVNGCIHICKLTESEYRTVPFNRTCTASFMDSFAWHRLWLNRENRTEWWMRECRDWQRLARPRCTHVNQCEMLKFVTQHWHYKWWWGCK